MRTIAIKLLLDQLIFSPIYIPLFFALEGFLEGLPFHEIIHNVKTRSIPTSVLLLTDPIQIRSFSNDSLFVWFVVCPLYDSYIADCIVWPPVQTINFMYVRPQYRVHYIRSIFHFVCLATYTTLLIEYHLIVSFHPFF